MNHIILDPQNRGDQSKGTITQSGTFDKVLQQVQPTENEHYYFEPGDPFEGRKAFDSFEKAALHAANFIMNLPAAIKLEYGYQIYCNSSGKNCKLGRLIQGTTDKVDEYFTSMTKIESSHPGGHSHPIDEIGGDPRFSQADFYILSISDPIYKPQRPDTGVRQHALLDINEGKVIIISMDRNLPFPPFEHDSDVVRSKDEMNQYITMYLGNGLEINIYKLKKDYAELCNEKCANKDNVYVLFKRFSKQLKVSENPNR